MTLRVFISTDHDGHWPVGVASVVVADDEVSARAFLDAELVKHGLKGSAQKNYTLVEVDASRGAAFVLNDGEY